MPVFRYMGGREGGGRFATLRQYNIQGSLYNMMMEAAPGCTVPWLRDRTNICINQEDREKAFAIYQGNRRNQHNVCSSPCTFTNMYFGPPVTGDTNTTARGQLILYFRKSIKVTTEFQRYTALSLIAEIGIEVLEHSYMNYNTYRRLLWASDGIFCAGSH